MKARQESVHARSWRTAVVTGASSGLGAGLARALVRGGVTTIGIARSRDKLAALATELGARFVPCIESVDDTAAHVATLRRFDDELGGIDLVIANAGVGADAAHPACSYEATHAALHTNFCGAAATLTWGSAQFFPASGSLILGFGNATHTLTFNNPIDLGGTNRTVTVNNGAAAVTAGHS